MYIKVKAKPAQTGKAQLDHMRINSDHVTNFYIRSGTLIIMCLNETIMLPLQEYSILEAYEELKALLPALAPDEVPDELGQPQLLPCPMCGSKAGMIKVPEGYKAGCDRCQIMTHAFEDEYSALVYWNYMMAE